VRADARGEFLVGAAVDGAVFAEDIEIADFEGGGFADVFEVRLFPADHGEWKKLVAAPEP